MPPVPVVAPQYGALHPEGQVWYFLPHLCGADSRHFGLTCCWNEQHLSRFQPLFSNRPLDSSGITCWLCFGSLILRMACYFPHTGASDTHALWLLAVRLYLLELSGMCCTWLPSSVEFLFLLSRGCLFNVIWESTSPNNKKKKLCCYYHLPRIPL